MLLPQAGFAQSSVAGGAAFTLVAKGDGTVWAFGLNNNGQLGDNTTTTRASAKQIAGLTGIQAVAAGGVHSMALTSGGALYVWGDNFYGQVGDSTTTDRRTPVLLGLSNVTAIAAGEFHSLALTTNGNVYAWGRNNLGQIGNGGATTTNVTSPTLVLTGAVAIGAGRTHSLAVKGDGTAWSWGANGSGQLGNNTTSTGATNLPVQMQGITDAAKVVGGEAHSLIILGDGSVNGAGENGAGQLADATSTDRWIAVPIGTWTNVVQIASGLDHSFARLADGSVWGWGENTGGQLGLGDDTADKRTPVEITSLANISAIAAGWNHSISVDSTGVVSTWGTNTSSQLGEGTTLARATPTAISGAGYDWRVSTPVLNPASGTFSVDKKVLVTIDTAGAVARFTRNGAEPTETDDEVVGGEITVAYTQTLKVKAWKTAMPSSEVATATITMRVATPSASPLQGTFTTPQNVTFSTTTPGATLRYTTDGTDPTESSTQYTGQINVAHTTAFKVAGFKDGWETSTVRSANYTMNFGTLSAPAIDPPSGTYVGGVSMTVSTGTPGVVHYTTGTGATPAGTPTKDSATATPVPFSVTTNVRARSFHPDYQPSVGEVTRTYTIVAHTPTLSAPSGNYAPGSVVTITAGLPTDTLRMTIDGTDPTSTSPIVVSGTSLLLGNYTLKVKAIRANANDSDIATATYTLNAPLGVGAAAAGSAHSTVATPDGRVYAFGENGNGQLGDDTLIDRATPTLLNSITGVTAVSNGLAHTLARTWDGQAYAWGSNASGRLGDGTTTGTRKVPYHIPTITNVIAVAAGDAHSLALTSDGRVYSWGENGDGQLGLGSTLDTPTPTEIPGLGNIVAIAAGDTHSMAITASGSLYVWGNNANSRLGDGLTVDRTSPYLLGLGNVVAVAAGDGHSVALTAGGAVYSWGLGTSGQLGRGNTSSSTTPAVIPGLWASAIAAAGANSAAIRFDGALVTWGDNASGQIGDTTSPTDRLQPTVVAGPSSVSSIALGALHAISVTPSGDVWSWGDFASGRLGDNSTVDRPTPAAVISGIANWVLAAPSLSVSSGAYASSQSVTVASSTPGVVLRYTLTGADPTESDEQITIGTPLEVAYSAFLRVRAFIDGRMASRIARADYELQSGAPAITPGSGTYPSAQTVSMTIVGPPATIRYTVDGSDPTSASSLYLEPLTVSTTTTIKARAFPSNGWPASGVSSAQLTFNYGQLQPPSTTPDGGVYATGQSVSLSASAGATIRYTTNGSDPTAASPVYSSAIAITSGTVTVKARAYHPDWTTSDAMAESFTIDTEAPSIVGRRFPSAFNGWHLTPVTITFACRDNVAVASCSPPATISVEGMDQTATGTAVDTAGRQTTVVETFNLDLTPPVLTLTSPTDQLVTASDTVTVTGTAADALSGVASAMCNGVVTPVVDGQLSCEVVLRPGQNTVAVSALDVAGHSASAAITVSRVGTEPSALTLTPNSLTVVVGEQMPLALRDAYGTAILGALWSSDDPNVVALSTDDPPTLVALAPGSVTVSAEKDGFGDDSVITVVSTAIAAGQQKWTSGPPSSPNLTGEAPIYANPVDGTGPDVFMVARDGTTGEWTVWPASTATGAANAMIAAPGRPLMGDSFGGLIAGVEGASTACSGLINSSSPEQRCYRALVRFAGPPDTPSWRYDSHGVLNRPAQAPDGAIYVIEHVEQIGSNYDHRSVVILDGLTGAVKRRVPLANNVQTTIRHWVGVSNPPPPDTHYYGESAPTVVGPIVDSDAFAYVVVPRQTAEYEENIMGCYYGWCVDRVGETHDTEFLLLRITSDGGVTETMLDDSQHVGPWGPPGPRQLLPNGTGGLLIVADHVVSASTQSGFSYERRVTHLDSEGTRTDTPLDSGTRIELIGQNGTAYVHRMTNGGSASGTSLGKDVVDVHSWQTLWSPPSDLSFLAASPERGAMMQNASQQLRRFDGTGQQIETYSASLTDPVQRKTSWIARSGTLLTAYAGSFSDATYWDATYRQLNPAELRRFGNVSNQGAPPDERFPWLPQGAPGIGPHEAIYDAFDDLLHRLKTDANLRDKAQTEVFNRLGSEWLVENFIIYLEKGRPHFYDGTRSTFCYARLAEHFGAFLCNPWLGQDVQGRFQSDGTLAALTWRGHEPLHVFFDPFFIGLEEYGKNLGNEALIFHEALHGFTKFPDEVLMQKLGVSGQTCGVEELIKNFVLPFAVPPIDPYVAWNCPR